MADDIVTKGAKRVKIHYQVPVSKDSSLPNSCWKLGEVSRPLQACWSQPGGGEEARVVNQVYNDGIPGLGLLMALGVLDTGCWTPPSLFEPVPWEMAGKRKEV